MATHEDALVPESIREEIPALGTTEGMDDPMPFGLNACAAMALSPEF